MIINEHMHHDHLRRNIHVKVLSMFFCCAQNKISEIRGLQCRVYARLQMSDITKNLQTNEKKIIHRLFFFFCLYGCFILKLFLLAICGGLGTTQSAPTNFINYHPKQKFVIKCHPILTILALCALNVGQL